MYATGAGRNEMDYWVDVTGGVFRLREIEAEILLIMQIHKPSRLVVDIKQDERGWYCTFYIPSEDFHKEK
jgi:hypothetical protein